MSSKSPKTQRSVKVYDDVLTDLTLLKDVQGLESINDVVRVALDKAYPNLKEIRDTYETSKEKLTNLLKENHS